MYKPLGLGIVGAGSLSIRGLLPHLTQPDLRHDLKVVAICDNVPGRAAVTGDRFEISRSYSEFEHLLVDDDVDIISLATPIGLHFEQGMRAIAAGKHVHFNKTMTTTVSEATQVIEAAQRSGVKIVASPGEMLWPINARIRELIQDGAIGLVAWANSGAAFGDYHENEVVRQGFDPVNAIDPSWYYRKPGGGPLYDMTVYGLHTLTGVLGPALSVTAMSGIGIPEREFRGRSVRCEMDDNTFMLVDFGNASFGMLYGTFAGRRFRGLPTSYFGQRGAIIGNELNGEPITLNGEVLERRDGRGLPHVTGRHIEIPESHVFEDVMQLVDWVACDVPPVPTVEHARHVIDIIESAYRAAETGERQYLSTTFSSVVRETAARSRRVSPLVSVNEITPLVPVSSAA